MCQWGNTKNWKRPRAPQWNVARPGGDGRFAYGSEQYGQTVICKTAKQARFVREYAVDCNGAAAAVRAGYSPRSAKVTASRLLTKANVQRALRQIQQVDAERLALSREAVIDQLQDAIELARVKQDPMAMIVGLRELGRMMGYYGPSGI